MSQTPANRILELRKTIEKYRTAYHVRDESLISDAALDSLKHELYTLELAHPELVTPDSPTQRVGGKPLEMFEKVAHQVPMLSIEDVFTKDEYLAWEKRIREKAGQSFDVFVMPKMDGLAMSLVYENGLLTTAATRGDGQLGENVTQNVKTIESVPLSLATWDKSKPKRVEVRGEIYFPQKAFEATNQQQAKEGKPTFANPRNAAAGSIRQLDPSIVAGRGLRFVAWDLITDLGQTTQESEWELLHALGFATPPFCTLCRNDSEVEAHWNLLQKKRKGLGFWIDGMVARVNNNQLFQSLGVVGKTPRGLVAWKFPPEEATTVVEHIDWSVGRTGALTPVATVKPVWVGGTTVSHASLHNIDEITRLDVRVGDTIILYKAGDIIPKVKEVILSLRPSTSKKIHLPTECPVCHNPVTRLAGEVAIVCKNPTCFAQNQETILHAVRAFGMDGIGPQTIDALLDADLINTPADLFSLTVDEFKTLEGFADLSAQKTFDQIQSHKTIALADFLAGLSIHHVGIQTARDLASHFKTWDAFASATLEQLQQVSSVGEVVATSIRIALESEHLQELLTQYKEQGIVIQSVQDEGQKPWEGKTFVLTGTLSNYSREQAGEEIRKRGGRVASSVSKNTFAVVVGDAPGSKLADAQKLGIKTLSEADFSRMLQAT